MNLKKILQNVCFWWTTLGCELLLDRFLLRNNAFLTVDSSSLPQAVSIFSVVTNHIVENHIHREKIFAMGITVMHTMSSRDLCKLIAVDRLWFESKRLSQCREGIERRVVRLAREATVNDCASLLKALEGHSRRYSYNVRECRAQRHCKLLIMTLEVALSSRA